IMFIEIPRANFRRLPFDHCSLSLQPFEYPMCTVDGVKLEAKSLIKLNFSKNNEGKYYHCPVLYTVFTNNSHIVANKVTGNVFSNEAVEQLNIKTKSYKDLLTDEPFTRQDLITLQDPTNLDKFNVSDFFHVKNNMKVLDPDEEKAKQGPSYHLKSTNMETRETLAELYRDYKGDELLASTMKEPEAKKTDKLNAAHYSTGRVSASFTSTAMTPATTHEADAISDDTVRYQYIKKKGYVRLHTNKGDVNVELHCDKSYWGKPFKDEFRPNLSHTGRGILSMANSGPNTNKSQFFITFRSCTYLDRKHSVFGRVVGGLETLTAMENVESDPKTDKPKSEIKLLSTTVFVDPYEEADAQVSICMHIAAEREKEAQKQEEERAQTSASVNKTKTEDKPKTFRPGVGKYINTAATKHSHPDGEKPSTSEAPAKKPKGRTGFGDFSSW
uniref:PPIase cyclophilin-type domain-containing protein n=1 Tax=Sinocyclocheilus rhinocerous TaxID=307959 RepID=A0A673NHH7_9TELE